MDVVVYRVVVDMVQGMFGFLPVGTVEEKCVCCQIGDHWFEGGPARD